jgi:hypothetical protein
MYIIKSAYTSKMCSKILFLIAQKTEREGDMEE